MRFEMRERPAARSSARSSFAESDGLVLPFLLHRAPELLERHRRQRTAHASLLSDITSLLAGKAPGATPRKPDPLVEPLSESEIRVLRYLPTNLSAPEIASELYLGVSTVKTHIHQSTPSSRFTGEPRPLSGLAPLACSRHLRSFAGRSVEEATDLDELQPKRLDLSQQAV